jgi:hypothetical protein
MAKETRVIDTYSETWTLIRDTIADRLVIARQELEQPGETRIGHYDVLRGRIQAFEEVIALGAPKRVVEVSIPTSDPSGV